MKFRVVFYIFAIYYAHTCFCQNNYVYEKGKNELLLLEFPVSDTIDLSSASSKIYYEAEVPLNTNTMAYHIELPQYIKGLFFSRDFREGDHSWPNNTNRLLPWFFNDLRELFNPEYLGIPSTGTPLPIGDVLLLQLSNDKYLFLKAVAGTNSLSWLKITPDGNVTIYVSTLGKDYLQKHVPLFLVNLDIDIYSSIMGGYENLIKECEISETTDRRNKKYFEAFEYLGWCTWEHYHFDIDESKIIEDLQSILASGIPIRYVLIDDGHVSNEKGQLTCFIPDKNKFPNGWKNIMAYKHKDHIRWIGLWHSLSGYWNGFSKDNAFSPKVRNDLYEYNYSFLPGPDSYKIRSYYHEFVSAMDNFGFDFLKIDNQSFTLPLYMGKVECIKQAIDCNRSLEEEIHLHQMGLINCMAQNVINTDNTKYSNISRVSIDYKIHNEKMAKAHLFQAYTNTLLFGQTVWPDHDMFHSSDSICGGLMARSKALSGGPVYLSDSPNCFLKENIYPLINDCGKLYRPKAPAIPLPESVFINPMWSGKAYKVAAPTGDGAMTIICYNLNEEQKFHRIQVKIDKKDWLFRNCMIDNSTSLNEDVLLYDWNLDKALVLHDQYKITLNGFTDALVHLCPIIKGWAIIGIQEKFLSPATVKILSVSESKLKLKVDCAGTLKVWVNNHGKQELRSIVVDCPQIMDIEK